MTEERHGPTWNGPDDGGSLRWIYTGLTNWYISTLSAYRPGP